jgi:predicted transposase YbfD/YdcC
MHCIVKKTIQTIIGTGNDYVVCVKKNQHKLYRQLVEESKGWATKIGYYKTQEKNRGRIEIRKVYLEYPQKVLSI